MSFTLIAFVFSLIVSSNGSLIEISCDFGSSAGNAICHYVPSNVTSGSAWMINDGNPRISAKLDGPLKGVNNSAFLQFSEVGRLFSPSTRLTGEYCLSLNFYLQSPKKRLWLGNTGASLNIFANPHEAGKSRYYMFTRNEMSSSVDDWQHFKRTVNFREGDYQIVIVWDSSYRGLIALDNLNFEDGPCPDNLSNDKFCDFDDVIGSADESDPKCDWLEIENCKVIKSLLRSRAFGAFDHSTRGPFGGQVYCNATAEVTPEIFVGQFTPQDGRQCLSFAMQKSTSNFQVKLTETAVRSHHEYVLLDLSGFDIRMLHWEYKMVDIDPVVPLHIALEVLHGEVMFDSIRLTKGRCPTVINCDFKKDFCDWTPEVDLQAAINWFIGRGRLENPGPHHVANFDNGLYADYSRGPLATFNNYNGISSPMVAPGTYCLKFGFQPQDGVEVQVLLRYEGATLFRSTVINRNTLFVNGTEWSEGSLTIKQTRSFSISLGMQRQNANVKYYRFRDTSFSKGQCGTQLATKEFAHVNFHCFQTGHYVPMYKSCDGVIDCSMGEDEGSHCHRDHECRDGGIPCKRRGYKFCLTSTDEMCDGELDCDDGSDEDPRLCNAESFCENYCLNGGRCNSTAFGCECNDGFSGKRCAH